MRLHHIGIAVNNIEEYYNLYLKQLFGYCTISKIINNEAQHSRIAFVENGQDVKLELIEAIDEKSPTVSILKRGMGGMYHFGFISDNFMEDIRKLRKKKYMMISNKDGIAFFLAPTYEIYELIDGELGW